MKEIRQLNVDGQRRVYDTDYQAPPKTRRWLYDLYTFPFADKDDVLIALEGCVALGSILNEAYASGLGLSPKERQLERSEIVDEGDPACYEEWVDSLNEEHLHELNTIVGVWLDQEPDTQFEVDFSLPPDGYSFVYKLFEDECCDWELIGIEFYDGRGLGSYDELYVCLSKDTDEANRQCENLSIPYRFVDD